ncbi:MAG: ATP-grasp domain-containing protein [Methylotenera sp.]|nr:ATP-grasp domain-containing protein [Methylotenera sp.]
MIIAPSARAYAQAAVFCGFEVITLDAFADVQTRAIAKQACQFAYDSHGVNEADFKRVFLQLDLTRVHGVLYGSCFDSKPDLLRWVAQRTRLLGNTPEVMQGAKSAAFFALLDRFEIQHPDVYFQGNNQMCEGWLVKQFGGAGGTHVRHYKNNQYPSNVYFQRKIDGEPVSLLFLAHNSTAQVLGFNRQLLAPTDEMPYRFAGAVGNIRLPEQAQYALLEVAQQLTQALGLRGMNSLDAIWTGSALFVLELNPRLSATCALYPNWLTAHLQACVGEAVCLSRKLHHACAEMINYAEFDMTIPTDFSWPNWVTDTPPAEDKKTSVTISKNQPVCSVRAEADDAEAAYILLQQRMISLKKLLESIK